MNDPGRKRYFIIKAEQKKKEMEEIYKKMIQGNYNGNGGGDKKGGR
jgi:hypothetical protein